MFLKYLKIIFSKDKQQDSDENPDTLKISRLESLSDDVFSIVMTLMIFQLQIPFWDGNLNLNIDYILEKIAPKLLDYFISFAVLGLYWIRQQAQLKYLIKANRVVLWINIFFLMFIALIPLSTSIYVFNSDNQIALLIYLGNLSINGIISYIHWIYVTHQKHLIDKNLTKFEIKFNSVMSITILGYFIMMMFVSLFHIRISFYLIILSPFIFYFIRRTLKVTGRKIVIHKHIHKKTEE